MRDLPKRIMEYAQALPEAAPICPGALLHLGHRAAIDQALSRLARSGELMRICQGVYMRPVETRFGLRGAPSRQGARSAVRALGRNHRALRRRGGQPSRADHAESGSRGLSHLRSQPSFALRIVRRGAAPCPALAARGPAPQGRRCHPRPGMARSGRSRGWSGRVSCRCFATRTATNFRLREPLCRTGWRNR